MKLNPVNVTIRNFQSIEDLEFTISGFTCVTGKTNIGKSAIMRAISGALLNKPVTNLVRNGAKSCSVRLSSIEWGLLWEKAEKGLNRYTIDGKPERLENVGQRQPEPVAEFGFNNVRVGDRDLYPWYASQWTPVFLLDEGGPTVTQFISEISGLDVLQTAIALGLRGKKKALEELKLASAEAQKFKSKLQKLTKLDDLLEMSGELENQAESINEYRRKLERRKELFDEIEGAANKIRALADLKTVQIPDDSIGDVIDVTVKMFERWKSLEDAARSVISLKDFRVEMPEDPRESYDTWTKVKKYEGIERLNSSIGKLKGVAAVKLPDPLQDSDFEKIEKAKSIHAKLEELTKSVAILESPVILSNDPGLLNDIGRTAKAKDIMSEMQKTNSEIDRLNTDLKRAIDNLENVTEELGKIPSCPTCNRPALLGHQH